MEVISFLQVRNQTSDSYCSYMLFALVVKNNLDYVAFSMVFAAFSACFTRVLDDFQAECSCPALLL